ncbi:MAG: 50S ribosomal protein L23 [Oscillospiraceae bacterium]|nr:50S ribosomal protein L23 [Oscillospiraceae bacterium]
MKTAYDVILRPIISEQSTEHVDLKKYVFEVLPEANKIEIKKAIEEIFDVEVIKVTTLNMKGKKKRMGRHPEGSRKSWKKAVVKLADSSKTIEFFEGLV